MKRYRVGLIGYGGFGQFLHTSWKALPRVEVAAVSDLRLEKAPAEGLLFFRDWRELLSCRDMDIISIVTPPSTHGEIACEAMEKGFHVLIEKPLAVTTEEARRIIRVRDQSGKRASVNYVMRYNPLLQALRALAETKSFGPLRRADVENYAQDSGLPLSHWFWDRQVSGGILIEHAVHFIDFIHTLTDEHPMEVTGAFHERRQGQETQAMASVLYDRGLIATHYHHFAYPGFFESTSIRLAFDCAVIDLEGWIPLKGRLRALVQSESEKALSLLPGFVMESRLRIDEADDLSRPMGWGKGEEGSSPRGLHSFGNHYDATHMVTATFGLSESKGEVYSASVARAMDDLIASIDDPRHKSTVTLEDGLSSLEIAERATLAGHRSDPCTCRD
ncbi:MAG: Gfo/Idh/MocA family oxidoreductase [Candidatus Eremiobacteraeota bacterium]|nr:Gfo/Idh/MocA family oxidoreductase [Candidatus Eremiobacteraeota bacterium]